MSFNAAIVIPARMKSVRLPGKMLADINGMPMILRVMQAAKQANVGEVFIACAEEEIANTVTNAGGKAVLTDPDLASGTDRIYAAISQIDPEKEFDIVINLQGDLPYMSSKTIHNIVQQFKNPAMQVVTAAGIMTKEEANNPNNVKIALTKLNEKLAKAHYFSRSMIPHNAENYYHHIGIYAYRRNILEKFVTLGMSDLEKIEKLEQLRLLENNINIHVTIEDEYPVSVDTAEDLEYVRKIVK